MKIRSAQVDDAATLARIHVDSWRAAYRKLVPEPSLRAFTYRWREECFRQALSTKAEETYLAEVDGEAVAFLTLGVGRDSDLNADRTGEIWGIYVSPSHWRQGVGRRLAHEAERLLISRGYEAAVLRVLEDNQGARRFYEAMGFRLDNASRIVDWGEPLKAVRYRKPLQSIGEK